MSSTAGAAPLPSISASEDSVCRELRATLVVTLLVLLAGLTIWLAIRRLGGAFTQPLSGVGVVAAAVVVELAAHLARRLATSPQHPVLSTQYHFLFSVLATAAAAITLLALSFTGTPIWGLIASWLVVVGGETAAWLPYVRPYLERTVRLRRLAATPTEPEITANEAEIPPGLVQQLTRVREDDRESIHVVVSAEIPSGDRIGVTHISFCPPLAARPELTAHAMDAEDVEVRLTQVESFGARVEVRFSETQTVARRVLIEVLGSITVPRSA